MEKIFQKINFVGGGYLILNSEQLCEEHFLRESRFRNFKKNFAPEPELPEELRNNLSQGEIAYIRSSEYTEYDDFWRKISREDFMEYHLVDLVNEARIHNIGRKNIHTKGLYFYQGYENGEFPGTREIEDFSGSLDLTLEKTDKGFNLNIFPKSLFHTF